jgi:GTPase SAR1 family protein
MNTDSKADYTLKILTIGESGVGKTCILLRYTDEKFMKNHLTTIGNNINLYNIYNKFILIYLNRNRLQSKKYFNQRKIS